MSWYSFWDHLNFNMVRSLHLYYLVTAPCLQQLQVFTTTKLSQSLWPTRSVRSTQYALSIPARGTRWKQHWQKTSSWMCKANSQVESYHQTLYLTSNHRENTFVPTFFLQLDFAQFNIRTDPLSHKHTHTQCAEWLADRTEPVLVQSGSSLLWKCHERLDRVNANSNGTNKQESSQPKGILRTRQFPRCNHSQSLSDFSRNCSSVRGLPTQCSVGTMDLSGGVQVIKLGVHPK